MERHPEARERTCLYRKDPRFVPADSNDRTQRGVGREHRGTNVGVEDVSYDLVAPRGPRVSTLQMVKLGPRKVRYTNGRETRQRQP